MCALPMLTYCRAMRLVRPSFVEGRNAGHDRFPPSDILPDCRVRRRRKRQDHENERERHHGDGKEAPHRVPGNMHRPRRHMVKN